MIGAGDLRLSLGITSSYAGENDSEIYINAVNKVIQVSKKCKKPLMAVAFKLAAESASVMQNFGLLLSSADMRSVKDGHRSDLRMIRKIMDQAKHSNEAKCNDNVG